MVDETMNLDAITARRKELAVLSDEIEKSDRPVRVKVIRLKHIRDEMTKLIALTDAAIERAEKADANVPLRPLQEEV